MNTRPDLRKEMIEGFGIAAVNGADENHARCRGLINGAVFWCIRRHPDHSSLWQVGAQHFQFIYRAEEDEVARGQPIHFGFKGCGAELEWLVALAEPVSARREQVMHQA